MPTVSLDKLEDAMQWASCDFLDNEAYICRQTGKIYWIAGDLGNQLVFDFATRYLAQHYDDVRDMFRRRGAYRHFKDFLERKDMLEKWHAYSDEQEAKALGEWCETEGLSLGP